jgi:mono/diheme cytochrome c family protein
MRPQRYLTVAVLLLAAATAQADETALQKRGEYVLRIAGCIACHTDTDNKGPLLAGGGPIKTPRGVFYPPNITPDPTYGIGGWSEADLARALTEGIGPDGRHFYPAFPYTSYTHMRRADIHALKAYLDTVPAVHQPSHPHELPWYVTRSAMWLWQKLYFTPGTFTPHKDKSAAWNRGAYLVQALGHCAECHSPRSSLGVIDERLRLAGTRDGPDGDTIPNITPDKQTGIGGWSAADLAYYLRTGADPDGDYAGGLMGKVIDEGLSHLTKPDARAIATYLRSLKPVHHQLEHDKKSTKQATEKAFYE